MANENSTASASAPAPQQDSGASARTEKGKKDSDAPSKDKDRAIFNDEIEIYYSRTIPAYDKGEVKAYAAQGLAGVKANYFAMMCELHLVPQVRKAQNVLGLSSPSLVKLVRAGKIYWPPTKTWRYCFIYENSLGKPLMTPENEKGLGMKPDHVMKAVIKPMINLLQEMRDADVHHGDIRPCNMFDGGMANMERVMLGECLSTPSGYTQPIVFETIERAMCDPAAKGPGTFEDDIYAFGVSLTMLMRKRDPLEGLSDDRIIEEKINNGSYAALTGEERFTGPMLELLRGLLYDDASQRWTINEILAWHEGQRLSPKQSSKKKKAARSLAFNNERYFRQSLLARDLNLMQSEAVQLVESGNMEQWISRSLEDNVLRNRLDQAVDSAQEYGKGPGYWDRLLARVSVALDPEAPIRYKGVKVHPQGFPYALSKAIAQKEDLQPYIDIINQQLVIQWLNSQQGDIAIDVGDTLARFDSCRAFLRQPSLGYGVERCVYFLCPDAPCLSDRVKPYYVTSPEELMYAFEEIATQPNRPELFLDRHIAAFMSVKERKIIDSFSVDLNAGEFYKRILGNMKVLAAIYKRDKMGPLPGVAGWIADIIEPLCERYHDRDLRDDLRQAAKKLANVGDIGRIVGLFDNPEVGYKDFMGFRRAMMDYNTLREETKKHEDRLKTPEVYGSEVGAEVAAIVSGILSAIIILVFSFMFFVNKGIF